MLYLYGDKNVLRALDESDFWKRQESEHTTVIQVVVTGLEEAYKKALNDFKLQMDETYTYIKRYLESAIRNDGQLNEETTAYVVKLITYCENQSESFVALLQDILANSSGVFAQQTHMWFKCVS